MNKVFILLPIAAAMAFLMKGDTVTKPRGIRNNNPGNIEFNPANQWRGQVGNDGRFAIFDKPENGIRALARTLFNYNRFYGISTVAGIINRYAPDSENNTAAYVDHVSSRLGVSPSDRLELDSVMPELVAAIINHENGQQPYTREQIEAGISLA